MASRFPEFVEKIADKPEKEFTPLTQRVQRMAFITELLLETLVDLRENELEVFKKVVLKKSYSYSSYSDIPNRILNTAELLESVFLVVQRCGQESLATARSALLVVGRYDLARRLSDCSAEPKKKHLDENQSALIYKVSTMEAVKEMLLETLEDFQSWDRKKFKWFLQLTHFEKGLPQIPVSELESSDPTKIVELMVKMFGQRCVEVTREVFRDMNRTDLVQRLLETGSGFKEKQCEDERWPTLIQKQVETMASVTELLLETLADLSYNDFEYFKLLLSQIHHHKPHSVIPWTHFKKADLLDTVLSVVQTYGQQSVEKTMEFLKEMDKTDLAQMLSDRSSKPKKKLSVNDGRSALIQKVATMAAVKQLLLETLNDLSNEDIKNFKRFLTSLFPQNNRSFISWRLHQSSDRADTVELLVDELGQKSMEVTRKVLMDMNRTDLVQKWSKTSSEKHSVDEHEAAFLKREEALAAVNQILLETLNDLSQTDDINIFWLLLPLTCFQKGLPQIDYTETTDQLVALMVEIYGQQSVEVTKEVFRDMKRNDLVQRLSEISSGSKGQEDKRSSELELCGSMKQHSSDWTKLDPEVNSTDADETPTYSLQSESGHFECSVSGLRWVCKEKASFQYQFSSWEGHMERMESRRYMPAGPLMDVTVTAGKLNEVHLPHWICTDDIPDILDQFAVLHIDDCGDVVEKVSEVTPSHVKITEPIFSPRAVLMKVGIPVKIKCNVLIYQTNTAFLTLHVYLVPCDPGLQQVLRQREVSHGYKAILKPDPEKSLKMLDRFTITADVDGAEICPQDLKLRYPSGKPNFFEVYTENPDRNFQLKLISKKEFQPVWTCTVRKAEYQSSGPVQENHFVDKCRVELIQRVSNIGPILDELLKEQVIQQESYDRIRALPTCQEKIRALYNGPLKAGSASKDVFYKILQTHERRLVNDLC